MKNVFAIVCEWPGFIAAENETIIRIKHAAAAINKKVVVIDKYGNILDSKMKNSGKILVNEDVDFAINLHFASAKSYDGFSYVALWNPIKFYHDWGYSEFSANLITHHDFISCLSDSANDHALRISHLNDSRHLEPKMVLSHTNCGPYHEVSGNRSHIFYCGINWDRSSGKSRFSEIFESLDKKDVLKIYGPRKLSRKNIPWKGFVSYIDEIPFDGTSTLDKISGCLLGLALSHEAHIESAIASSRVFELIAGGALPICDENPFFKKHFGDKVLYVMGSEAQKSQQILDHYRWADANRSEVKKMVDNLQILMKEKFDLTKQLKTMYQDHPQRRSLVESKYLAARDDFEVNVIYVHDVGAGHADADDFCNLKDSVCNQGYKNINLIIASNCKDLASIRILDDSKIKYTIINHNFEYKELGLIIDKVSDGISKTDSQLFMVINRYERLFYDHISSLVRRFEDNENLHVAESASVISDKSRQYGPFVNYGYSSRGHKFPGYLIFTTGAILIKTLPPKFILKYLSYTSYNKVFRSFYESHCYEKTKRATICFLTNNDLRNDDHKNNLSKSLFNDYGSKALCGDHTEGMELSKNTAYNLLSYVKVFYPILKIRKILQKRRIKRRFKRGGG